jgi:hypothetical protein
MTEASHGAPLIESNIGERIALQSDPRSVHAMLVGCDDARTMLFVAFQKKLCRRAPHLDGASVDACYQCLELSTRVEVMHLPRKWQPFAARLLLHAKLVFYTPGKLATLGDWRKKG